MSDAEEVDAEVQAAPDAHALGDIMRGVVEPWADAEKVKAVEATRRYETMATVAKPLIIGVLVLLLAIVALAFVAFLKGEVQTAEKIVIAIVSFVGGYGAGRTTRR